MRRRRERERARDREREHDKDRPAREARDRADREHVDRARVDRERERADRERDRDRDRGRWELRGGPTRQRECGHSPAAPPCPLCCLLAEHLLGRERRTRPANVLPHISASLPFRGHSGLFEWQEGMIMRAHSANVAPAAVQI